MKNLKFYIWWMFAVAVSCVNAFLFGETGDALFGLSAGATFLAYSSMTMGFYRRRKFQLLLSMESQPQ